MKDQRKNSFAVGFVKKVILLGHHQHYLKSKIAALTKPVITVAIQKYGQGGFRCNSAQKGLIAITRCSNLQVGGESVN
jgi:hypothetical protein